MRECCESFAAKLAEEAREAMDEITEVEIIHWRGVVMLTATVKIVGSEHDAAAGIPRSTFRDAFAVP